MPRSRILGSDPSIAVGLAILTLLVRLPFLRIPFERDEGEYAYIAWRVLAGDVPYRDAFDQKPPGIFLPYLAALSIPVDAVVAVHLIAALWVGASTAILYWLARRLTDRMTATFAGFAFALLSIDPGMVGSAANTELFMNGPIIAAHALFAVAYLAGDEAPMRFRRGLAIGALLGCAMAFKPVAAVNWLFFLVVIVARRPRTATPAMRFAGASALGIVLAWLPFIGWFAAHGALPDLVQDVFLHNLRYSTALPLGVRMAELGYTLATLLGSQAILWAFATWGATEALRGNARAKLVGRYVVGWAGLSFVGVSLGGYYFPHYFQQLAPPLAIMAGLGASEATRRTAGLVPGEGARRALVGLILASQLVIVLRPFATEYTPERASQAIYPGNPFDVMPAVGARIAELTRPEESVYVFGAEPEVLFYARRRSATRYIFLFPLFGPYPNALAEQKATAREIRRSDPAVVFYMPNSLFFMPGAPQFLTRWTSQLLAGYRLDSQVVVGPDGRGALLPAEATPPPKSLRGRLYRRLDP